MGLGVGEGVGVADGVEVGVGVGESVGVGVGDGVGVDVGDGVGVGVGVGDGVGVGEGPLRLRVISKAIQLPEALMVAVSAGGIVPAFAICLSPSKEAHGL